MKNTLISLATILFIGFLISGFPIIINGIKSQGKPWTLYSEASLGVLNLTFPSAKAKREGGLNAQEAFIRINQAGYLPSDNKRGTIFSNKKIKGTFKVLRKDNGEEIFQGKLIPANPGSWGNFSFYYHFDFSDLQEEGIFIISFPKYDIASTAFPISEDAYLGYTEDIITFMHQQ